jgi:hypothetical protein
MRRYGSWEKEKVRERGWEKQGEEGRRRGGGREEKRHPL